ncbi:B-4DMT family transporter [Antrihabitans cavernicola]|uniref:Uncharacterized protein n=1 Tax=Antrihabitans cavernicola TaxID=2495913 RepID=A0A5A7SBJ0_9NOCA|nr:B-4DMT family transporter [Spelaeibacter cavernicola]KAA0023508.1 hypothetical protein FOY51_08910 [Spelaeibacter cavernicola]
MSGWLVRGLGLALVNVVIRTVLGLAISEWPLHGSPLRWLSVAVMVLLGIVWGFFDGRRDRRKNPDPERGADLTMLWLKAAVLGGLVAGAVSWIVDQAPKFDLGDNPLFFELTSGAAWTILLIFIPALIGVALGRWLASRKDRKAEKAQKAQQAAPVAVGAGAGSAEPVPQPSEGYFSEDNYSDRNYADENYASDRYSGETQSVDTYYGEPEETDYNESTGRHEQQTWQPPTERRD